MVQILPRDHSERHARTVQDAPYLELQPTHGEISPQAVQYLFRYLYILLHWSPDIMNNRQGRSISRCDRIFP